MVRNALRKELAELLSVPPGSRQPALRRSRKNEWLYASDLPLLYHGNVPNVLQRALTGAGWEYSLEGNWLQLRKAASEPPADWYGGDFGPEAACCRSLLERHTGATAVPSDDIERALIKAGEEGRDAYEDACTAIHREWAARLRKGLPLPAVSKRYFGA